MTRYPVIPLRDVVVFPGVTMPLFIKRPATLAAVAAAGEGFVVLVAQRSGTIDTPTSSDLHAIGTLARVVKQKALADLTVQLLVTGERRVRIEAFTDGDYLQADVIALDDPAADAQDLARATDGLSDVFRRRFGSVAQAAQAGTLHLRPMDVTGAADRIVALMQQVLELPSLSPAARLERLTTAMAT